MGGGWSAKIGQQNEYLLHVGGMPLAFMQEDFLVYIILQRKGYTLQPYQTDHQGKLGLESKAVGLQNSAIRSSNRVRMLVESIQSVTIFDLQNKYVKTSSIVHEELILWSGTLEYKSTN